MLIETNALPLSQTANYFNEIYFFLLLSFLDERYIYVLFACAIALLDVIIVYIHNFIRINTGSTINIT